MSGRDSLEDDPEQRLTELLEACPSAMTEDELLGFLTAVATAPSLMDSPDWISVALGEAILEDEEAAREAVEPLLEAFEAVSTALSDGPGLLHPEPDDLEGVADWCAGYVRAAKLDAQWLSDPRGWVPLIPMDVLGGGFPIEEVVDEDDQPIANPEAWLERQRQRFPEYALEQFHYWAEHRDGLPARDGSASAKVGRNDPCPCGSGKKYKRCCLKEQAN